jgi:Ca-activated chloride channel family protein
VTDEQKEAARTFTQYVLTPVVQKAIMAQGFRPAKMEGFELGYPFVPENGVTPQGPTNVLDVPAPEVIAAIQQSWSFVKKQADIMLLIDVSGSMANEGKIDQAKQAAIAFLENMEPTNRVGLAVFSSSIDVLIPLDNYEANSAQLRSAISALQPQGDTELYQAVREIVGLMNDEEVENRIRAVVLLSDGADTGDEGVTLNDATQVVSGSRNDLNPVILIPVAYGSDADVNALSSLARASSTRVSSGDPKNILGVLEIISSYF